MPNDPDYVNPFTVEPPHLSGGAGEEFGGRPARRRIDAEPPLANQPSRIDEATQVTRPISGTLIDPRPEQTPTRVEINPPRTGDIPPPAASVGSAAMDDPIVTERDAATAAAQLEGELLSSDDPAGVIDPHGSLSADQQTMLEELEGEIGEEGITESERVRREELHSQMESAFLADNSERAGRRREQDERMKSELLQRNPGRYYEQHGSEFEKRAVAAMNMGDQIIPPQDLPTINALAKMYETGEIDHSIGSPTYKREAQSFARTQDLRSKVDPSFHQENMSANDFVERADGGSDPEAVAELDKYREMMGEDFAGYSARDLQPAIEIMKDGRLSIESLRAMNQFRGVGQFRQPVVSPAVKQWVMENYKKKRREMPTPAPQPDDPDQLAREKLAGDELKAGAEARRAEKARLQEIRDTPAEERSEEDKKALEADDKRKSERKEKQAAARSRVKTRQSEANKLIRERRARERGEEEAEDLPPELDPATRGNYTRAEQRSAANRLIQRRNADRRDPSRVEKRKRDARRDKEANQRYDERVEKFNAETFDRVSKSERLLRTAEGKQFLQFKQELDRINRAQEDNGGRMDPERMKEVRRRIQNDMLKLAEKIESNYGLDWEQEQIDQAAAEEDRQRDLDRIARRDEAREHAAALRDAADAQRRDDAMIRAENRRADDVAKSVEKAITAAEEDAEDANERISAQDSGDEIGMLSGNYEDDVADANRKKQPSKVKDLTREYNVQMNAVANRMGLEWDEVRKKFKSPPLSVIRQKVDEEWRRYDESMQLEIDRVNAPSPQAFWGQGPPGSPSGGMAGEPPPSGGTGGRLGQVAGAVAAASVGGMPGEAEEATTGASAASQGKPEGDPLNKSGFHPGGKPWHPETNPFPADAGSETEPAKSHVPETFPMAHPKEMEKLQADKKYKAADRATIADVQSTGKTPGGRTLFERGPDGKVIPKWERVNLLELPPEEVDKFMAAVKDSSNKPEFWNLEIELIDGAITRTYGIDEEGKFGQLSDPQKATKFKTLERPERKDISPLSRLQGGSENPPRY